MLCLLQNELYMELITSIHNPKIKHLLLLQQKSSARRKEGLFVVEGQRELEHCVAAGYEIVETYRMGENVSEKVYEHIAYRGTTEGVIAIVRVKHHDLSALPKQGDYHPLYIVLERVEKPGNLGAILRSADASGVDAVIVCDPLTDIYNPNIIRGSIGAVFTVPTVVCSSEECINFMKERGVQILTAQLQDSNLYYDQDMTRPTAIVMGTEATGLTDQWREAADAHIRIPMLGRLDSLNVSVSAAILMYEAVRQRGGKK